MIYLHGQMPYIDDIEHLYMRSNAIIIIIRFSYFIGLDTKTAGGMLTKYTHMTAAVGTRVWLEHKDLQCRQRRKMI